MAIIPRHGEATLDVCLDIADRIRRGRVVVAINTAGRVSGQPLPPRSFATVRGPSYDPLSSSTTHVEPVGIGHRPINRNTPDRSSRGLLSVALTGPVRELFLPGR